MNNFDNLVQMLYEEINDSSAIVYHRTNSGEALWNDLISGKQFVPGNGDYYGKGFYSTYDLESQLGNSMKNYGNYILKAKIKNLQNFFIFDPIIYRNVNHKDPNFLLEEQWKRFNIKEKKEENDEQDSETNEILRSIFGNIENGIPDNKNNDIKKYYVYNNKKEIIQPQTAKNIYDNTNLMDKCSGIIYSGGRHDGNVLVVYPSFIKGIIPMAISNDEGKTWKKLDINNQEQKNSYINASKNIYKETKYKSKLNPQEKPNNNFNFDYHKNIYSIKIINSKKELDDFLNYICKKYNLEFSNNLLDDQKNYNFNDKEPIYGIIRNKSMDIKNINKSIYFIKFGDNGFFKSTENNKNNKKDGHFYCNIYDVDTEYLNIKSYLPEDFLKTIGKYPKEEEDYFQY